VSATFCTRSVLLNSDTGRQTVNSATTRPRGKGGVLPKEKITKEIAEIRGIPMGVDCHSPNRFEEFDDASSLIDFIARVRKLTGKPIGLKMVVGASAEVEELPLTSTATRCRHYSHRARIPVLHRLHPGAPLSHQHVSDGRRNAESVAAVGPRCHRQERASHELLAGARAQSADDHARMRLESSERTSPWTRCGEHLAGRQKIAC
jgi:hypothetical protein